MDNILMISQVVISILLSLSILLQQRGSGLGAAFGGEGGFHTSKRGAEKVLSNAAVVLTVLFVANSMAFLFI